MNSILWALPTVTIAMCTGVTREFSSSLGWDRMEEGEREAPNVLKLSAGFISSTC